MLIKQGKTNIKYLLIVAILAAIVGGGVLVYYWQLQQDWGCIQVITFAKDPNTGDCKMFPNSCVVPKDWEGCEILSEETADWKTYRSGEYGFEFRYPSDFTTEEKQKTAEVFSPKSLCETDVAGDLRTIEATEVHIKITRHNGTSYEQIWQDVFGFGAFGADFYDGTKIIGGKESKYFAQGAEGLYGRVAYLVKISQTEALEINTYIPILIYRCNPPFNASPNDLHTLYDQILSTFKFLD